MKTIKYNGKAYEIDKDYLFGDYENDVSKYRKLKNIDPNEESPFEDENGEEFKYIKQLPSSDSFGTITDASADLVDGAAYIFDILNTPTQVGLYREFTNNLWNSAVDISVNQCTNIRKMGVIED